MLTVPLAPRYRMTAAPLIQAVAQLNFPIVARLGKVEGIAPLQDALADLFPYMNQRIVQEVSLMVGPAGPAIPESAQSVVHDFSDDAGWRLSVTVGSASLSIGAEYTGVDDFAERFERVCAALHGVAGVRRCDRLGVRYLDLVDISHSEDEWSSWFRPEIVGLAHTQLSGSSLLASLTETRMAHDPASPLATLNTEVQGVIRHGVVPPGSVMTGVPPQPVEHRSFLFDMDTFVTTPQHFDEKQLVVQYRALHAEIEKIFHWAVTDEGKAHFGYERIDDPKE